MSPATLGRIRERCPGCGSTGPHHRMIVGGGQNYAAANECPDCGERWV